MLWLSCLAADPAIPALLGNRGRAAALRAPRPFAGGAAAPLLATVAFTACLAPPGDLFADLEAQAWPATILLLAIVCRPRVATTT